MKKFLLILSIVFFHGGFAVPLKGAELTEEQKTNITTRADKWYTSLAEKLSPDQKKLVAAWFYYRLLKGYAGKAAADAWRSARSVAYAARDISINADYVLNHTIVTDQAGVAIDGAAKIIDALNSSLKDAPVEVVWKSQFYFYEYCYTKLYNDVVAPLKDQKMPSYGMDASQNRMPVCRGQH